MSIYKQRRIIYEFAVSQDNMLRKTAEQDYMMSLIVDWAAQAWELLLTLGWWIIMGLTLSTAVQILPLKGCSGRSKNSAILVALVCGALLPVCNFAAISVVVVLLRCGVGTGVCLAFLCAATLLNPAGILSGWAYMGPSLTVAYVLCAVTVAAAVGLTGRQIRIPAECTLQAMDMRCRIRYIWSNIAPELAFWVVLGVGSEALLMALMPKDLWKQLLMNPKGTSFIQAASAGLFRHVCIPDDVALAASLTATGFRPGCAVLFRLVGVCTNLPELFVLSGMAGTKTAAVYLGVTAAVSVAAAFATELVVGAGFVPHFNLTDAETYTRIANLLSIRTWMSARIPCAIGLSFLACWRCWIHRNA